MVSVLEYLYIIFPPSSMPTSARLPDAMPDIASPLLFVVCDSHQCRVLMAEGRTVQEQGVIQDIERPTTDREGQLRGPGGTTSGSKDINQFEEHRIRAFANLVVTDIARFAKETSAKEIHLSAPAKVLSQVQSHMPKSLSSLLRGAHDGMFIKEAPLALLTRFRPDMADAADAVRDQENYSPRKVPPRK